MSASEPSWVIVGNAGCRRVAAWTAALADRGATPRIVEYSALLNGEPFLSGLPPVRVRFESAAEHPAVRRLLLQHGRDAACQEGYEALDVNELPEESDPRAPLLAPRQVHLGFERLLQSCRRHAPDTLLNPPDDILVQFDKMATLSRLRSNGLPVPEFLEVPGNYDMVRRAFRGVGRAMVKLRHGSGGAGCVAIHWTPAGVRAFTTAREVASNLITSKTPDLIRGESNVARLVNRLAKEKIHVEEWFPKARWGNYQYDFRIVTVAGRATHAVARGSLHTFTNLNLGNRRLPWQMLNLGDRWNAIRNTAEQAASLFPQSHTLGIDIAPHADGHRHYVLEINAFGNLLPNLFDDRGRTTYQAAVDALTVGNGP